MPVGRPTKYDPEMCETVVRLGAQGWSKVEISQELGITYDTFNRWEHKHEEFSDAVKEAERQAESWFRRTFRERGMMAGGSTNATCLIFAAKNQLPDAFKDKHEHEHSGKIGTFEIDFTGYDPESDDSEDREHP